MEIAITGIGMVTPMGSAKDLVWENCLNGLANFHLFSSKCGELKRVVSTVPTVGPLAPINLLNSKEKRSCSNFMAWALMAAKQAVADSGLDLTACDSSRIGVSIGSGVGAIDVIKENAFTLKDKGPMMIAPRFIPTVLCNLAAGQVAISLGLKGYNLSPSLACASGLAAIIDACRILENNEADVFLAGGSEACVETLTVGGFAALRTLAEGFYDNPEQASRPFDKNRKGFVIAEGSAILVLERVAFAQARKAKILGYIHSYGGSCDAFHITAPSEDGSGAQMSMERCLKNGQLQPKDIGAISAHATSTPIGDLVEFNAIKKIFQADTPILALKSLFGHTLGASGALATALGVMALDKKMIPAIKNLNDPLAEWNFVTSNQNLAKQFIMVNSFGFGGTNFSLCLRGV